MYKVYWLDRFFGACLVRTGSLGNCIALLGNGEDYCRDCVIVPTDEDPFTN